MDAVKDFIKPKTFSTFAYVCSIAQFVYCVTFISYVVDFKDGDAEKFTCFVAPESTLIYKTQVDKACLSRYQQKYNSPLPFHLFVVISGWLPFSVALIYSLRVHSRVKKANSNINATQAENETESQSERPQAENETESRRQTTGSSCVFYFYFIHLAIRALLGIVFTVLQYTVFFPNGFDFEFNCGLKRTQFRFSTAKNGTFSGTSVPCENPSAREKHILWVIVPVFNIIFAFAMVFEMIRLCICFPKCNNAQFIAVYLLRKQYRPVDIELPSLNATLPQCIHFYKGQVLRSPPSTDVSLATKSSVDDLYVDLLIHSKRAPHEFAEKKQRHEIYDVYMKVPETSIRLREVKDLFYPNEDTKREIPKAILVVGRLGIGKTVLTEKIKRDWAGTVDKCYDEKVAFYFQLRWFNEMKENDINLKTFLHYGTGGLSDEKFDQIYEYIIKHSEKAIFVFDGLDEFNGNSEWIDDSPPIGDRDSSMSWISWFKQLMRRHHDFLPEATIVVTSRPTANEFYSRFRFDRTVEIIGFTPDKIEAYVEELCHNNGRSDLTPKVLGHIFSNSDIKNLCYIPVNCWIVSTTLFECFEDPESESASVPSTLTELYQEAVTHLDKHHFRGSGKQISAKAINKFQELAFDGIEHGQLVFSEKIFDKDKEMKKIKKSGLLNKISKPQSQTQQQFCFVHLTIQEFLAAKHVMEYTPEKVNEFVTSNFSNSKWHLVLQFIAGLLGEKITKLFQRHYIDCVLAFPKCLNIKKGKLELTDDISLRAIKCVREFDNEELINKATDESAMNDVVVLSYHSMRAPSRLTFSDWDAVALVCKRMENLTSLELWTAGIAPGPCVMGATKLLEQRWMKKLQIHILTIAYPEDNNSLHNNILEDVISALLKSSRAAAAKHRHSKITELDFYGLYGDDRCAVFSEFFEDKWARDLEKLKLSYFRSPKSIMPLLKVLTNEHCPELSYLDLNENKLSSQELRVLCDQRLFKLTVLCLDECSLDEKCIPLICELLTDERCNLTRLSLKLNPKCMIPGSPDGGVQKLFGALQNEHCKLNWLNLSLNHLTDQCIPGLCNALQNKHCKLSALTLAHNEDITDEGLRMLCECSLPEQQQEKKKLNLYGCSLTNACIPYLSNAVKNERFILKELTLIKFSEKDRKRLRELETNDMTFEFIDPFRGIATPYRRSTP